MIMRVSSGPGALPGIRSTEKARKQEGTASFSASMSAAAGSPPAAVVTAPPGATPLFSLQEENDTLAERRRAWRRGTTLLDELEKVRLGLIMGEIPEKQILNLQRYASERLPSVSDPALREVLEEIETRAAIELAKLTSGQNSPG